MAPSGKRIVVGCGIGCATLFVLLVAGAIGFGVWFNTPGELLEPGQLLGSDTTAYAELSLSLDDPETAAFVGLVIERVQNLSPQDMDGLPGWISSWQNRKTQRDIEKLFPLVAAWTLRPAADPDQDLQLVSLSLTRASHQFVVADWILGWVIGHDGKSKRHAYGRENIYQFQLESNFELTFFIHQGNLFFTSDLSTAEQAVDRLRISDAGSESTTELDQMFASVADVPFRAALTNRRGEILRLWTTLGTDAAAALDPEAWDALRGLTASAALEPDGSLVASLEVLCPDAEFARSNTARLIDALERSLPESDLQIVVRGEPVGAQVRLHLRVDNLIGSLEKLSIE